MMLKKIALGLLTATLLALPALSAPVFAADRPIELNNGKLKDNRMLIPLRDVAQNMGAAVEWNQQLQTIEIQKDDIELLLTINSKKVLVHQAETELDVPAQLINNTTYVPLRFVSQLLGASVDWNSYGQVATITLEGKQLVVYVEPVKLLAAEKASAARLKQLSDKLNEAADVSSMKQIRTYFKPYFTDRLINVIIQNKGLEYNYTFKDPVTSGSYRTKTTGSFLQSLDISQDAWEVSYILRDTKIIKVNGVWKADSVSFTEGKNPISGA
ncbi:copper amine oxidase N-terminal domain-containing protein [Paenibacillus sp. KS-LC4]|uniref:copper amine oxidase N-terminal domain-containing protein n=1 Tax=Paenibacillus sp. KS-LC4 TaxID=2979727 RepID=UPI0030CF9D57